MSVELKIPNVGESIQEVQIARWLKKPGDAVEADENIVELETDKASMELPAPAAGVLSQIVKKQGESVSVGDVIAVIEEGTVEPAREKKTHAKRENHASPKPAAARQDESEAPPSGKPVSQNNGEPRTSESGPVVTGKAEKPNDDKGTAKPPKDKSRVPATPSARRALHEHGLEADEVSAAGDRLRPSDVRRHVESQSKKSGDGTPDSRTEPLDSSTRDTPEAQTPAFEASDQEELVPMSLIRRRIAERLVAAQRNAALLTTFNEIDMTEVIELREKYRPRFAEKYQIKLGFMSFFVKAVIDALRQYPAINAEIRDGDKIAYRNYYHIGIAVGGGRGLVVPVLFHAERMSFAEVESHIADFAERAQKKKLKPEELQGGTFTISNGGVYGSLLSTPIVNPPQSGVLGMHAIQDRPVARDKQVVIRPMMYVALTYDHRLVDGTEAVSFLKRIKDAVEDPARMLIEV